MPIAPELGTREIAVKIHRSQVTHRMQTACVAELIRTAPPLGLPTPRYEPPYTKV